MKNRLVLFIILLAAIAAFATAAALIAGRESVNAVIEDAIHWFQYFSGPIRRG